MTGRRPLVFDKRKAWSGVPIRLPCSECPGCVKDRARMWAIRCMHERRMHGASAFVTLTYNDESLPANYSLSVRTLQLFMKKFRKNRPPGLRFFACGEYGETTFRPHYHVLLLNTDFPDRIPARSARGGEMLYSSKELSGYWEMGDSFVGDVTDKSCAYVAGYVNKKMVREDDILGREPEFRVMSRRPGIGMSWFVRFNDEAYRDDSVIFDGYEARVPRYYDGKFEKIDSARLDDVKKARRRAAMTPEARFENTRDRRLTREFVQLRKQRLFKREI